MSDSLNKNALITGAGRRIGRAIVLDLAQAGWSVVVHYHHSKEEADSLISDVLGSGGAGAALNANLGKDSEVANLLPMAEKAIGKITCLINNASTFEQDTVKSATRRTWDLHMGVNLRAPFLLSQAFVEALPNGTHGNIINIIDQRVWNLTPDFTTYTLSKAGLWGLTQILARALAPKVRVNGIGPGPTLQSVHQSAETFSEEWNAMPLARQVKPEDICRAVRFILDSPAVTGQMIAIDAGQHMGMH